MMRRLLASLTMVAIFPVSALAQQAFPGGSSVEVGAAAGWTFQGHDSYRKDTVAIAVSVEAAVDELSSFRAVYDRASWPGDTPSTNGDSLTAHSIRLEAVRYQQPRGSLNAYSAVGVGAYRALRRSDQQTLFAISGAVGVLVDTPRGAWFGEFGLVWPLRGDIGLPGRFSVGYRWRL